MSLKSIALFTTLIFLSAVAKSIPILTAPGSTGVVVTTSSYNSVPFNAPAGLVVLDSFGKLPPVDGSQVTGVTASPAGADTQIQFNKMGVLFSSGNLTFDSLAESEFGLLKTGAINSLVRNDTDIKGIQVSNGSDAFYLVMNPGTISMKSNSNLNVSADNGSSAISFTPDSVDIQGSGGDDNSINVTQNLISFRAGANDLMTIDGVTIRVGINNTSPSYPLDVVGDINASGNYRQGGTVFFDGTDMTVPGLVKNGYEQATNTCAASTTCVATCTGGAAVVTGGGCDADTSTVVKTLPLGTNSWQCDVLAAATISAYVFCARVGL